MADRTDSLRDSAERFMCQTVQQDPVIGPFRYRWSVGDEPFFHFSGACLDREDLERVCEHRLATSMPRRQDIEAQPNYTEEDLKRSRR